MSTIFNYDPVLVLLGILKRNAAQIQTPHGFIAMVTADPLIMMIEYGIGLGESYTGRQLNLTDGVCGQVLTTGRPQIVSRYDEWQHQFRNILPQTQHQVGTVAGTPIHLNGVLIAILIFIFEARELCPKTNFQGWLQQISDSASTVLTELNTVPPSASLLPT